VTEHASQAAVASQRQPCSGTSQESQVEGGEDQDNCDIHYQSRPELIPEEQKIHTDDRGDQQQYVKCARDRYFHVNPSSISEHWTVSRLVSEGGEISISVRTALRGAHLRSLS
jgi:hypothetical protein